MDRPVRAEKAIRNNKLLFHLIFQLSLVYEINIREIDNVMAYVLCIKAARILRQHLFLNHPCCFVRAL